MDRREGYERMRDYFVRRLAGMELIAIMLGVANMALAMAVAVLLSGRLK